MEPKLENSADRRGEPELGRSFSRHREPLRKRCVVINRQLRAIIARNAVKLAQTA
jgi:hypothetical protein